MSTFFCPYPFSGKKHARVVSLPVLSWVYLRFSSVTSALVDFQDPQPTPSQSSGLPSAEKCLALPCPCGSPRRPAKVSPSHGCCAALTCWASALHHSCHSAIPRITPSRLQDAWSAAQRKQQKVVPNKPVQTSRWKLASHPDGP